MNFGRAKSVGSNREIVHSRWEAAERIRPIHGRSCELNSNPSASFTSRDLCVTDGLSFSHYDGAENLCSAVLCHTRQGKRDEDERYARSHIHQLTPVRGQAERQENVIVEGNFRACPIGGTSPKSPHTRK